ncbi:MAG: flagellar MotB protein [Pseudomonadota bacterium]|jgi:chemotaxis protein MotB
MASNVRKLPVAGRDQVTGAAVAVDDDDDGPDCPKCPPVGAPAWLATFADIATNLMAFFVLILGFAKFDEPSFAKMAGSMRETFGTSMIDPILQNPPNGTVIEFDFQSGEDAKGEAPSDAESGAEGDDRRGDAGAGDGAEQGQLAAKALLDALSSGTVAVEQGKDSVTVRIPEGAGQPDAKAVAEALAALADTAVTGAGQAPETAPEQAPEQGAEAGSDAESAPGRGGQGGVAKGPHRSPGFAEARLSVMLREEIGRGLVQVERREGKVFVTVGEGGGFASGSADLTEEARALMARIAETAMGPDARVTVTGHTDSVPLGASPYVDNLGLGAARAAAVVRELVATGQIDPAKALATSKGEMAPVADNATEEGRAKNRRIEIEIDYDAAAPLNP